eukprot:TRINITY_DN7903_c0_g1_i11.p2 TRINITY_DN7903_c0_g1~~TRINITY_DN7903_c0_g1_i11.p2  ORF type:complete len:172 (-),score=31.68 TRINITY_DN7903_c0_g1_i11:46-561(-)
MDTQETLLTPPEGYPSLESPTPTSEFRPSQGSVPGYLTDPSQVLPDPAHNVFASVESLFADSPVIHFTLSRSGYCKVDFDFKFFKDESVSPESVILEGKASVNYTCLLSTPWAPNVNITMNKPNENEFGKTLVIAPGSFSGVFVGSQYEGRVQPFTPVSYTHLTLPTNREV